MNEMGALAQSHDGTLWRLNKDATMARGANEPFGAWRDINEVRMEAGVLWPASEEPNG